MSDVEITVPVPEWLADSLALVAKICEKSIDQVASVLFARSASAPRERKEVYHKSPRLWGKRFTAEKMPPASGAMLLHRGLFLGSDRTFHLRLKALLHVEFSCPSFPLGVVDSLPPYFMATNPPLDHLAVRQLPARQRRQRHSLRPEQQKRSRHQVQKCTNV